jgi:hypothetical protein
VIVSVVNQDQSGSAGVVAAAPTEPSPGVPSVGFVAVCMGAVAIAVWLAYLVWDHGSGRVFVPRSDYTALAGVVLLSTAVERLLEPVSYFLLPADPHQKSANDTKAAATDAAGDPSTSRDVVQAKVQEAADAGARLARRKNERKILFWAIATVIALFTAAVMGVFLVGSIADVALGGRPNRVLDLAVTGLIIGAGTKPTHDLISSLGKAASK